MIRAGGKASALIGTAAAAGRRERVDRSTEAHAVTRDETEALVARERPGWRVVDTVEVNDESDPSFEVVVQGGDDRVTLPVGADERTVGGRR